MTVLAALLLVALVVAVPTVAVQAYRFGCAHRDEQLSTLLATMPPDDQHLMIARLREARRVLDAGRN